MGVYGVDIHPRFQAGISIEEIRREGFDFMAVKVSEGLDGSYLVAGSADFLRRGGAAGLLCLGYHYLHAGDEDTQAKVFAEALRAAGVPGMLDAEALASDGRAPTLTVAGIRGFLDACGRLGARVPLLYLPHWYWERLGRPSLAGLPPLWGSSYVSPSDPHSWSQLSYDVGFDPAGGWEGGFAFSFGVQEWAGRSTDPTRGHLSLASWIMADRSLAPVDQVFTREGGGQVIFAHNPTRAYGAPNGAVGLTLDYAAPGGAYVTEGRSG
jgi:hypothetical protein